MRGVSLPNRRVCRPSLGIEELSRCGVVSLTRNSAPELLVKSVHFGASCSTSLIVGAAWKPTGFRMGKGKGGGLPRRQYALAAQLAGSAHCSRAQSLFVLCVRDSQVRPLAVVSNREALGTLGGLKDAPLISYRQCLQRGDPYP